MGIFHYVAFHRDTYKTSVAYARNLVVLDKESIISAAAQIGLKLSKSHTKERLANELSEYVRMHANVALAYVNDEQMLLSKDTSINQAIVERILLKKNEVKDYVFNRIRGAWMLREIRETSIAENINASFLAFYQKFVSDKAFQVKSLNSMVKFVGPDPDDDFSLMEGVITPDTWEAFAPELPKKTIYNIIYGEPKSVGSEKIFILRGIANGMELELRFRKVGERWLLMKMTT
jgi:hypothetical protein